MPLRNILAVSSVAFGLALPAAHSAESRGASPAVQSRIALPETSAPAPVVLPLAQQFDVTSTQNGVRYRIFVSVPTTAPPPAGHPVIHVLDGNAAFPVAAFLARGMGSRREVTGHIQPIVVGIGYPDATDFDVASRRRDYTLAAPAGVSTAVAAKGASTTPAAALPTAGGEAAGVEGRAEDFLNFIERELRPLIAARHPVDPARQALFGHSFGGLFVLHAAFTRPALFSTFIASSPSIWWQDKVVLSELPHLLEATRGEAPPRLMISVGALEDTPRKGNYAPETLAMLAKRPMVSEARALDARLKAAGWGERLRYFELDGEDHGPAWLAAMSRGMQFFMEQP